GGGRAVRTGGGDPRAMAPARGATFGPIPCPWAVFFFRPRCCLTRLRCTYSFKEHSTHGNPAAQRSPALPAQDSGFRHRRPLRRRPPRAVHGRLRPGGVRGTGPAL